MNFPARDRAPHKTRLGTVRFGDIQQSDKGEWYCTTSRFGFFNGTIDWNRKTEEWEANIRERLPDGLEFTPKHYRDKELRYLEAMILDAMDNWVCEQDFREQDLCKMMRGFD